MASLPYRDVHSCPANPRRRAAGMMIGFMEALEMWLERKRQRRALLELSDALLKDVGLSRADAWREAGKPFWRP